MYQYGEFKNLKGSSFKVKILSEWLKRSSQYPTYFYFPPTILIIILDASPEAGRVVCFSGWRVSIFSYLFAFSKRGSPILWNCGIWRVWKCTEHVWFIVFLMVLFSLVPLKTRKLTQLTFTGWPSAISRWRQYPWGH